MVMGSLRGSPKRDRSVVLLFDIFPRHIAEVLWDGKDVKPGRGGKLCQRHCQSGFFNVLLSRRVLGFLVNDVTIRLVRIDVSFTIVLRSVSTDHLTTGIKPVFLCLLLA